MSEYHLHVAIVNHLRGQKLVKNEIIQSTRPFPDLFICHINQGRSKDEGFFLKRMGVYPGVADLLCLWKGGIGFIEIKTEKGSLSPAQKKFKGICHWLGIKWALARSVKDAHEIVKRWGLKSAHDHTQEPDLRSDEQKQADYDQQWGVKKYLTPSDMADGKINPDWNN